MRILWLCGLSICLLQIVGSPASAAGRDAVAQRGESFPLQSIALPLPAAQGEIIAGDAPPGNSRRAGPSSTARGTDFADNAGGAPANIAEYMFLHATRNTNISLQITAHSNMCPR